MKPTYYIAFWSPAPLSQEETYLGYFSRILRSHGNIQCIDCSNASDRRTLWLLNQADLVVVSLRQSYRHLVDYFCRQIQHFHNCIYLMIDYLPDEAPDVNWICREFRISQKRIACIPFNGRLYPLNTQSDSLIYLLSQKHDSAYEQFIDFRAQLNRCIRTILFALDA